jgi:hypothetical protein
VLRHRARVLTTGEGVASLRVHHCRSDGASARKGQAQMTIKLISAEHGRCGVLRRYQHDVLGVLNVITQFGAR